MLSETESLALQLVRALINSTGGGPHEWRMLEELDGATKEAIKYAAARGRRPTLFARQRPVARLSGECGFLRGTDGDNRYGPDPLAR